MVVRTSQRKGRMLPAVVVFACVLTVTGVARAGSPVWYAGDVGADAGDRAMAQVQAALGPEDPPIGEVAPLDVALFGDAQLWPVTNDVRRCTDGTPIKLETAMARAERALEEVEFDQAVEALAALDGQLACVEGALSGENLGLAALMLGHVRHLTGDVDGARRAFAQAAVFEPDVVWDGNYSPAAQPIFNAAVLESLRTRDAHVRGNDGSWTLPDVELDGGAVPRYGALRPGWHQLALRSGDGGWVRTAVELEEGQTLRLVAPADLASAADDPGMADALVAAIVDALETRGAREAWIVDLAGERLYRYRTTDGALAEVEVGRSTPGPKPKRPRPERPKAPRPVAGPALVIGGGITTASGLIIGLVSRKQAYDIYDKVDQHNDQFERYDQEYQETTRRMTGGYVLAAIGGAILVAGIPTWVVESKRGREAVSLSATVVPVGPGAEGGAVLVSGRW